MHCIAGGIAVVLQYTCTCAQDEKALFDAAQRGDVFAVRKLVASHVNVDFITNEVCVNQTM